MCLYSSSMYDYLMNTASVLFFVCYVPELYANYKNKNANIYNLPEKVVMLAASGLALFYAVLNTDDALILNYAPILTLDVVALGMRGYYAYKTRDKDYAKQIDGDTTNPNILQIQHDMKV